jgi:hypothetical protein
LTAVAGAAGGCDRGQPHEPGRDTARNRAYRRASVGQPSAGSSAGIVAAALLMRLSSRGEWWIADVVAAGNLVERSALPAASGCVFLLGRTRLDADAALAGRRPSWASSPRPGRLD